MQVEKSAWALAGFIGIAQSIDTAIAIAAILYVQFATTKPSGMRMRGQAIVTVLFDPMVLFTRLSLRIDMNDHQGKVFKMM